MGRFVSATGQFLLATYGQFSRPPTGSFSCPLTEWPVGGVARRNSQICQTVRRRTYCRPRSVANWSNSHDNLALLRTQIGLRWALLSQSEVQRAPDPAAAAGDVAPAFLLAWAQKLNWETGEIRRFPMFGVYGAGLTFDVRPRSVAN